MTTALTLPPDFSGQISRELYVPINAMLSSISELQEALAPMTGGDRETVLLLKLLETAGSDLRSLIEALHSLPHGGAAGQRQPPGHQGSTD